MATQLAKVVTNGVDIDGICDELELEVNISAAAVIGHYEPETLTNPATGVRCDGSVLILITGTADSDITTAAAGITSTADIVLLTNAEAALDAET